MSKIAHLADIQIRLGSRHQEYRQVFERTYEDLKMQKPKRIYLAGDINHNKADMSPNGIDLLAEFFRELSKIAPVDVIPGNHDVNLAQIAQGDSLQSIIQLMDNGKVVTNNNKKDFEGSFYEKENGKYQVYYYPESGLYNIDEEIVYGHFSCLDNELITIKRKDPNKKYIAFYHGAVHGSMNDNGYQNNDPSLYSVSVFNDFDMVMMGDIHEHQAFRDDFSMAYAGSLIQQGYGEGIEKGYLIWDLDTNQFRNQYILNDFGWAKVTISQGESWEDRLEFVKFSNNKKKTKIYVEWEDFEENISVEKSNQIMKYIKSTYGCEVVNVIPKTIYKNTQLQLDSDKSKELMKRQDIDIFKDYLIENKSTFDYTDDLFDELLKLFKEVDTTLEIKDREFREILWDVKELQVSNLFSYPSTPKTFNFDDLAGITGIFGENYCGKTNMIKCLVWVLFQQILDGGDTKKLVNIYTESDRGWAQAIVTIDGSLYKIYREVTNRVIAKGKKEGEIDTKYKTKFEIWNEDKEEWEDEVNDKKTNEQKAVKELIENSLGEYKDFTKTSLQSQSGQENYINADQQQRNTLIRKFMDLESYDDRYNFINDSKMKAILKKRKELGDLEELHDKIKEIDDAVAEENKKLTQLNSEKSKANDSLEEINSKILDLTGKLEKVQPTIENSVGTINEKLTKERTLFKQNGAEYKELDAWLSENLKREMSENISESASDLSQSIANINVKFKTGKEEYQGINAWLKEFSKITPEDPKPIQALLEDGRAKEKELRDLIATYLGKECPTCGTVSKKPQPDKEKGCVEKISIIIDERSVLENKLSTIDSLIKRNATFDQKSLRLSELKNSLLEMKTLKEECVRKLEVLEKSRDILEHNSMVDEKNKRRSVLKQLLESSKNQIEEWKKMIVTVQDNQVHIEKNAKIQSEISKLKEIYIDSKELHDSLGRQISLTLGDITFQEKNSKQFEDKLKEIKNCDLDFKKYSIFLQAVHRDGIPAKIIKKRLPIVNSKIKSIIRDLVQFNIELEMLPNGNIHEFYYYNHDQSDKLPLTTASGSQKFMANLAIKDAMHFATYLPKPSMCIVDEGFDVLAPQLKMKMNDIFQYWKNKYKNVFIVTHDGLIKDFVENVITVYRTQDDIPESYKDKYAEAWTTGINIT